MEQTILKHCFNPPQETFLFFLMGPSLDELPVRICEELFDVVCKGLVDLALVSSALALLVFLVHFLGVLAGSCAASSLPEGT